MAESNVKVLGLWESPFVMRVNISLHLKSVNFEFIEENLLEPHKSELLLKSNPVHKKIPVLFHGDNIICESLVILQYIDEVWISEPSILPSDPYERAESRFWAAYVDDKFFPTLRRTLMGESDEVKTAAMAEVLDIVVVLEEGFKKLSKGKAYFGGDNIGYVDIALGSLVVWIKVIEKFTQTKLFSEAKTPGLLEWAERFSSHGAAKEVLPEVDKLADFALKFAAKSSKGSAETN